MPEKVASRSRKRQAIIGLIAAVAIAGIAVGGVAVYKLTRETGDACESNFSCPFHHMCVSKRCAAHCDTDDDCPRGAECTRGYLTMRGSDTDYDSDQQRICWPPINGESRASLRAKNKKPPRPMDPEKDARLAQHVRRALDRELAGSGTAVRDQDFDAAWKALAPNVKRSHGVVELARLIAKDLGIELPAKPAPSEP